MQRELARLPLFFGSPSAARFLSPPGKETLAPKERAEKATHSKPEHLA
jgi:hypothetical protein